MERKVYLILTDTGTLFTRMIKLYTRKTYNHASLTFDPYFTEIYSFGRKRPRNPFIGGFVKENRHTGLLKQAKCVIYCCSISEKQYQNMIHYIEQIEEQKDHYRYNLLGLFVIPFNKTLERENRFFCSQFVATVLTKGQVADFAKQPSLMTPYDLQKIPHFQLVYQGDFAHYKAESHYRRDMNRTSSRKEWLWSFRKKLSRACTYFLGF